MISAKRFIYKLTRVAAPFLFIQEPTSFVLDVYDIDLVWKTPDLIQSLAEYATSQQPEQASNAPQPKMHQPSPDDAGESKASVLLLRVQAAADYFTDNVALMNNPPPVLVDLILDPFVFNAVPRSLLPTAGYLILVGLVTWFVAQRITSTLRAVASSEDNESKKRTEKLQRTMKSRVFIKPPPLRLNNGHHSPLALDEVSCLGTAADHRIVVVHTSRIRREVVVVGTVAVATATEAEDRLGALVSTAADLGSMILALMLRSMLAP